MTKDEALRLALEALQTKGEHHPRVYAAITAIKAALEAKDEPDHSDELTIAYMSGLHRGKEVAQRTWVGLTDEEKKSFWTADQMTQAEWDALFNAIEAKLRRKNYD